MNILHICAVILLSSLLQANASSGGREELQSGIITDCAKEAKRLVDKAYTETRTILKSRVKRESVNPSDLMSFFKQPVAISRNAIRAADYMELTLQLITEKLKLIHPGPFNISDVLTAEQKEIISKLSGCAYQYLPKICDPSRYRSITGECNNIKKPILGASNTGYTRLLNPEYEDGISLPRGWTPNLIVNGFTLPLLGIIREKSWQNKNNRWNLTQNTEGQVQLEPRAVSNEVVSFPTETLTLDDSRSLMFMQWGQFLDHDTDLSPDTPSRSTFVEGTDCETSCARAHPCFPLMIPKNDPRIRNSSDCIPMFRSAPVCSITTPVREQINVLTSYIDGSQVYGSDAAVATRLRNNTNQLGLLAINQNFTDNGYKFLPFTGNREDLCTRTNKSAGIPCFLAGDSRVNEQPGLIVFHTLFLREHNRIATQLHILNPHWSGETVYQETRKIVGSILQKITYKDWLPLLLGNEMQQVLPSYRSYNENEDPRVSNVFTIAFRMGHTLIQPFIYRLADGHRPYSPEPAIPLHMTFFTSWRVVRQGGLDPLLRGMMGNRAKLNRQNQMMVDELRERLFKLVKRIGLDLASLNIQRGREHGLAGYNSWRRFCGLSAPRDVAELATVLNNKNLAKTLIRLYGTAENIDVWVGGVSEPLVPNGRTGKLLSCLIGDQFRRSRDGDRFYYEHSAALKPAQRKSIDKVTLASIICNNSNINKVPQNVFMGNSYPRDFVNCNSIPSLDLGPWRTSGRESSSESNEKK